MTSESSNLEQEALALLERALGVNSAGRRAWVISQTEGAPLLRERVLSLLSGAAGDERALATGGGLARAMTEAAPDTIGPYRVERELGRGGMGAVYLARRISDDFEHLVAIKLVRRDVATPRLVERLRGERRTLARLKHPNIAQMYDGGETGDGAPYVVMEYVSGAALHDYVAGNAPRLAERLDIFLQVCDAVSCAHRNLVIHRDLTPANILVSDAGHVKLIDFGISQSLDDASSPAGAALRMTLTKGYDAPERAQGAPASTMTDIYSLGVILGELASAGDAPRGRDLSAIVAKACDADPERRYRTVDALARDVRAYQRGESVDAVGGGWPYHISRFIGRRTLAVGAGAAVFVGAFAAGVAIFALYLQAQEAEARATRRFDETRELAHFVMFDFYDEVAKLDGSTGARGLLAEKALAYLNSLSAAPGAPDELKLELSQGFKRLSDITGNPGGANLGGWNDAEALAKAASDIIEDLRAARPNDRNVLVAYIDIFSARAALAGFSGNDYEAATALLAKARDGSTILVSRSDVTLEDKITDTALDIQNGFFLSSLARGDEAVAHTRRGVEKFEALLSSQPESTDLQVRLAAAKSRLGEAEAWRAYFADESYHTALPHFDAAVASLTRLAGAPDASFGAKLELVRALYARANTVCYIPGREEEGLADVASALAVADALEAADPENSFVEERKLNLLSQRFDCHRNLGEYGKAVAAGEAVVAFQEANMAHRPDNPEMLRGLANLLNLLALSHRDAGRWEPACATARRLKATWARYDDLRLPVSGLDEGQREIDAGLYGECEGRGLL
jgi:eukaryotic-like serine/threonine-protein kinase